MKAFDGSEVSPTLPKVPCGDTPIFDSSSGYTYRCEVCFAVIGSIGQPPKVIRINKEMYNLHLIME